MKKKYPWIYKDLNKNVWKYYLNQNKELVYKVMYNEGKWTREKIVCKGVDTFTVYVDIYDKVHIVYSNLKGELGYCTMKNNQWMGKILYNTENSNVVISDLKVKIIGENMHVFYLLCENNGRDHGVLMHCIWNGRNIKFNKICDIILPLVLDEYYDIRMGITGCINLFFTTDIGDEVSLNYVSYENNFWTEPVRLYGLKGENISFKVLITNTGVHILNKIKENLVYTLEHVWIDFDNRVKNYKVFESEKEIIEPIIFYKNSNIYICFIQENKIKCLLYGNDKWSKPMDVNINSEINLQVYNYVLKDSTDNLCRSTKMYGTNEPDVRLFNFNYLIKMTFDLASQPTNKNKLRMSDEDIIEIKEKISGLSSANKIFENKISLLQMELQKKQNFIDQYEKKVNKVFEQKNMADKNCNMLAEMKNKVEEELKNIKEKLEQEQSNKELFENQNKMLAEENSILKTQIEKLNEENEKIKEQLELERNESIFTHLLRKKSDDI